MVGAAFAPATQNQAIRYEDNGSREWLWSEAPCRWHARITLEFRNVPFRALQAAASRKDPSVVFSYEQRLRLGRTLAPLVVSETGRGTYYIHDGNHRHLAMRSILAPDSDVRVAIAVPTNGYHFQWRWFGTYGTYVLEPEGLCHFRATRKSARSGSSPLLSKTLVLVAHPDDETGGCAALLQRLHEPIVVFATDGAPADEFFWEPYGSREAYSQVRRNEARQALSGIGVKAVHFLSDFAHGARFEDQRLYKSVRAAIETTQVLVQRYRPDAILIPAYEGGHPDHDTCSFIGSVLGELNSLPIWEMPLYHRSRQGALVCQHFRDTSDIGIIVRLTETERLNRSVLIANYASQTDLGEFIKSRAETFRPQKKYDYSKPPHEGELNYQAWSWPICPQDLCRQFEEFRLFSHPRGGLDRLKGHALNAGSCLQGRVDFEWHIGP